MTIRTNAHLEITVANARCKRRFGKIQKDFVVKKKDSLKVSIWNELNEYIWCFGILLKPL